MGSAAEEIAELNEALAEAGVFCTFRRRIGTTDTFVSVDVVVQERLFRSDSLVGNQVQTERRIITSPTLFEGSTAWPGAAGGGKLPRIGDKVVLYGVEYSIEVEPLRMAAYGSIVRLEMRIKGG